MVKKRILSILLVSLVLLMTAGGGFAATINIDASQVVDINSLIYGNNMNVGSGYAIDTSTGWGAWDPCGTSAASSTSVQAVVDFAQDAGITILRFPGGEIANEYHWLDGIGPYANRPNSIYGGRGWKDWTDAWDISDNKYGTDEHMAFSGDAGAEVMVTVNINGHWLDTAKTNWEVCTKEEAAAWVAYLNGDVGDTNDIGDGIEWKTVGYWATLRGDPNYANHPAPYNIQYWEIGNEVYNYHDPTSYSVVFKDFVAAMKQVDPDIKVGAVLDGRYAWFKSVIGLTGNEADFFIYHSYNPMSQSNDVSGYNIDDFFRAVLAVPSKAQSMYTTLRNIIEITPATAPRAQDIELLITEWNIALQGNANNEYYQYTLGGALQNAEMLNILMVADNKIGAANVWEFKSYVFGQVEGLVSPDYTVRPNQSTFEMYANYFGTKLVNTTVTSDTYDTIVIPEIKLNTAITSYTTDANDTKLRIWLQRTPGTNISGDIWYDDIVVRESGSDLNLIKNSGFEDSPEFTGWVHNATDPTGVVSTIDSTTSRSDSNSFKLSFTAGNNPDYYGMYQDVNVLPNTSYEIEGYIKTQAITPEPVNWLTDPNFEDGSAVWTQDPLPSGVTSAGLDDTGVSRPGGSNSYKVEFDGTQNVDYTHTSQTVDIDPNFTYVAEGYVKTINITSNSGITLELVDNSSTPRRSSSDKIPEVTGTTNDWTYIAVNRLNPGDNATKITVKLRRYSSGSGQAINGEAWWDDIRLQPLPQSYAPNIQIQAINSDTTFDKPTTITGLLGTHDWLKNKTAGTAYLSAVASKDTSGNLYLMVINKNLDTVNGNITTTINMPGFYPLSDASVWTLNTIDPSDSIDTTNETSTLVGITSSNITDAATVFDYNFPAHSLTAIVFSPAAPDANAPTAPTGLVATAGDGQVSLDWDNNTEGDLAGYNVYRSQDSNVYDLNTPANGTSLVATSNYLDSTATNGTTYYYIVTAVDYSSNESGQSNEVNATPTDLPPAAPTGLTATAGDGQVSLDWANNTEGDLAGYNVYRSQTSGVYDLNTPTNTSLVTSGSNYVDTTAINDTPYFYVVTAVDTSSNESSPSNEVPATPEGTPPVGFWKMDELSWGGFTGEVADSSGSGNDGTAAGNATTVAPGVNGSAAAGTFDGNGDHVTVPDSASITFTGKQNFSIAFWIKPNALNGGVFQDLVSKSASNSYRVMMAWDDNIKLSLMQPNFTAYSSSHIPDPNAWEHIAVVVDFNGLDSEVRWYVNGEPNTINTLTNANMSDPGGSLVIADMTTSGNERPYNGLLDEVRLYDVALTAAQIAGIYGVTDTNAPDAPTALVATAGDAQVSLDWADNTEGDLAGYNVYRRLQGSVYDLNTPVNGALVDVNSYVDIPVTNDANYFYVVTAVDTSNNESVKSNEVPATPTDMTAPTPDPMTWETEPNAISSSSISMTATLAIDDSGVLYYFKNVTITDGTHDSGWQTGRTYTDTGLSEATEYTYQVQARDESPSQNTTALSDPNSATTIDVTPPTPDPMTWAIGGSPEATGATSISMTATSAIDNSGGTVEYYFTCTAGGGNNSGWQLGTTYEDTGLTELATYTYTVKARDPSNNVTVESEPNSATTIDITPPTPDPMTWATGGAPSATGTTSISMTATSATDNSGLAVEYYFTCTAGGGNNSNWQLSTTYEDTGLTEAKTYTYTVEARDPSSNVTVASDPNSATTIDVTPPTPDPMTWATGGAPSATGTTSISMTATSAIDNSGLAVEYYFTCTAGGGNNSNWQLSTTYEDTGLTPDTTYTYTVEARDPSSNVTVASDANSATTDATPPTSDPVAYWPMDENTGSTVEDVTVNLNDGTINGTINGGATWTTNSRDGLSALSFDGTDDYVGIANSAELNTGGPYPNRTITAWFKTGSDIATRQMVYEEGGGARGFSIYVYDSNVYVGGWNRTDYTPIWDGTWLTSNISADTWYHIALVLDDVNDVVTANKFKGYLNGTGFGSGSGGQVYAHGGDIAIGRNGGTYYPDLGSIGVGEYFNGTIDEVKVYNAALTTTEIAQMMSIAPSKAINPSPADSATDVSATATLSWTAGAGATGHDVYFGTSSTPPKVSSDQPGTTYDPGTLVAGTTYYWQIDEVNAYGTRTGTVWSFTTEVGLVGHWALDDGPGSTTAADSSSNGYTGTLYGNPVWTTGRVGNYALDFNGVADYVEITGYNGITGGNTRTVAGWIKTTASTTQWNDIVSWGSDAGAGTRWQLTLNYGYLFLGVAGGFNKADVDLSDGGWHHVAAVLTDDGSPTILEVELYVDGVKRVNSGTSTQAINTDATANVKIGSYQNYFEGVIDQVKLYDVALTVTQINQLYNE